VEARNVDGLKYHRLTIIKRIPKTRPAIVECICECGKTKNIRLSHIIHEKIKSCGCLNLKNITKHNMTNSKTYASWKAMRQRCANPNYKGSYLYIGKGISCDKSWTSFKKFHEDMGDRPDGKSLDRIDGNKGYSKENCRWATPTEQSRNTSKNRLIEIDGVTKCLSEWCEIYDMPRDLVHVRIYNSGISPKEALSLRGKTTRGFKTSAIFD